MQGFSMCVVSVVLLFWCCVGKKLHKIVLGWCVPPWVVGDCQGARGTETRQGCERSPSPAVPQRGPAINPPNPQPQRGEMEPA